MSQSELSRHAQVDRSTISQLLTGDDPRLPGAHLAAQCAEILGVSADWLLGLTERSERAVDILEMSLELNEAQRSGADHRVHTWLKESWGAKVRHVPASLPDALKTEAVLQWEYSDSLAQTAIQAEDWRTLQLQMLQEQQADMEICFPIETLHSLAAGEGYWSGLPRADRLAQLQLLADYCDQLYPTLRIELFNAKQVYSAPLSVYGTKLAVVYVGRYYFVHREGAKIKALINHFDWLVRSAVVDARQMPSHIRGLIDTHLAD
ncbi:MAG: helix-turn-helix transcriptional regulator [Gammaproteobacteria bacterium]|nr:helix-turn-helix transcriptional regulator [Gammaproteobacteria bacterium]